MSVFTVLAVLITLTTIFSYLNEVYIKLPSTTGVMVASLVSSLILIILGMVGLRDPHWARVLVDSIDFDHLLMKGMLSFLLFAAALRVDLTALLESKWKILYLATAGVGISTFLTGFAVWWVFGLIGLQISILYALLLGALISPTDAVSVFGLLKRLKLPKRLATIISGENLFNDAVAVVIFLIIVGFAVNGRSVSGYEIGKLIVEEAVGGIIFGLLLGYISYYMIKRVDNYIVIVLITLSVVSGGYELADKLHTSGPLSMVIAGLFLSPRRKRIHQAHSEITHQYVRNFWDLIDQLLNAFLFVLIGLEVLILDIKTPFVIAGLITIPIIIISRLVSVGTPLLLLSIFRKIPLISITILTWCGLRGGVSIALALSLPESNEGHLIVVVTYMVVIFSILVQGLTLKYLVNWAKPR